MRDAAWGADFSEYVCAVSESMEMLAEVEGEELTASLSLVRYREGEIRADRLRDEVGEVALRAFRIRDRLARKTAEWKALVAGRGAFPASLSIPLGRNVHRIGAVCSRIEGFEREAGEAVAVEERLREEDRNLFGGEPEN